MSKQGPGGWAGFEWHEGAAAEWLGELAEEQRRRWLDGVSAEGFLEWADNGGGVGAEGLASW
jgi:hypothetical protein